MLTAGLITISRRGTPIDRFRDRITFAIRDLDSQLVGFTARAAPTAPDRTPKYLNTPSTPAYHKSAVLFGLGEAKANHSAEAVVVTEGPLDALAVALAGEGRWAPLALCGTSLTTQHARQLSQLSPSTLLAFDDDSAGHRALERAIATLTPIQGEPTAAPIGLGQDPAGLFSRLGPDALRAALESATPASDLVITRLLQKWGAPQTVPHQRHACLREAATTLVQLGVSDLAPHAVRLSAALSIDPATVTHELAAAVSAPGPDRPSTLLVVHGDQTSPPHESGADQAGVVANLEPHDFGSLYRQEAGETRGRFGPVGVWWSVVVSGSAARPGSSHICAWWATQERATEHLDRVWPETDPARSL
jgi:DNA primase